MNVALICFGFLIAIIATIAYDLVALQKGWRTISEETYRLGYKYPTVVVFMASILLIVGLLIGHLYLGQPS